jgi:hypothetical protein
VSFTVSPTWTVSPTATLTGTPSASPTISPTYTVSPTPQFLGSGLGKTVLGPVPAKRGQPICLYFKEAPSSSQWTIYSMDQAVIARLGFGSEASQCWTQTNTVAPGVYWVHLSLTYASGSSETKVFKIMVVN